MEKIHENIIDKSKISNLWFKLERHNKDITICDDGTVFILEKSEIVPEKNIYNEVILNKFKLLKLDKDGQEKLDFGSKDKYLGSMKTVCNGNRILCIGLYFDKGDDNTQGFVKFEINKELMSIKNKTFSPFTQKFMFDKFGNKNHKDIEDIQMRDVFFNSNNEIIVTAEEVYSTSSSSYSTPSGHRTSSFSSHFFNDIICAKLDKNGKVKWIRNINKHQEYNVRHSSYIHFLGSFASSLVDNKLYLFFNSRDKVKKLKGEGRVEFRKGSGVYVIEVDENGNYTFDKILSGKESKVEFMIGKSIVHKDDIFIPGYKDPKRQTLKLRIK